MNVDDILNDDRFTTDTTKEFVAAASELIKFNYENEKYIIRPITTQTELLLEGMEQQLSLMGFSKAIEQRLVGIFTLRSKDTPEEPFIDILVDLSSQIILESKKKGNMPVFDLEIKNFIKQWEKEVLVIKPSLYIDNNKDID